MTYQTQSQLENDYWFQQRNQSCTIQQAESFKDDQRPAYVALAQAILRGDAGFQSTFVRMAAAGPGIADKVTTEDGIDSSLITDADLLSLTQANWPTVASIYFNEDGTPIRG